VNERIQPGSPEELRRFAELQARLPALFRDVMSDPASPRTVVVVPALSLDPDQLSRIAGTVHYEERHLSMLLLLRMPATRLVYVTSQPLHAPIVDYYLGMLQGVPPGHARKRLVLVSAFDGTPGSLTGKLLSRPRLLGRLRRAIGDRSVAHLSVFNSSPLERSLAVALGIPLYACDPDLSALGGKSGARRVFREADIPHPDGSEGLRDSGDVIEALVALKRRHPDLRKAVVKLDEGFSGEGNATFSFDGAPSGTDALRAWVGNALPRRLTFTAANEAWEQYSAKLADHQGIVEAWVEGADKRSPSAQYRISPLGDIECLSTHDQVLGGASGQVFLGSRFPACKGYAPQIARLGQRVAKRLRDRGVIGRFAVDFVVVREDAGWRAEAIEINLRKGGTTFPFQMLQLLAGGQYDPEEGAHTTRDGRIRCYYATDNLVNDAYRRLTPEDVVDIAIEESLHYDAATERGIAFSLLGCVAEYGKLGITAIDATRAQADALYRQAVSALDAAAG
jgi:hypothetical protein